MGRRKVHPRPAATGREGKGTEKRRRGREHEDDGDEASSLVRREIIPGRGEDESVPSRTARRCSCSRSVTTIRDKARPLGNHSPPPRIARSLSPFLPPSLSFSSLLLILHLLLLLFLLLPPNPLLLHLLPSPSYPPPARILLS